MKWENRRSTTEREKL